MFFVHKSQLVRRFFLALVLGVPLAASAEPIITGNTISWPDDGWYQVQVVTDEGQTQVCGGTRFCEVPNGTYIVINHTTGERFENIVVSADPAMSEVTVKGNTISWPDNGWYQVQVVTDEGQTQVCGGTRFCEVPNGTYIVINHTTGERFENIIVSADPAMSEVTVTGNTISWPDNGWYQVQVVTDEGQTQVCGGTRFCEVPNGTYIVINHTTGERFENIVVSADPAMSKVTVTGNTISWTDNGWYQVQAVTDEGITQVCGGTLFCEVPNGTYIVINHTTGERFEPVIVDSESVDPGELPVIRADNWQEILRNVIALTNADRAVARRDMLVDRFASLSQAALEAVLSDDTTDTLASLGLTLLPLADPDDWTTVGLSCDGGGDLTLTLTVGVSVYSGQANNCAIGGDIYDGGFYHYAVGRESPFSLIDDMSVSLSDSTRYSLSGSLSYSYDRIDFRRSVEWLEASMSEQSGDEDYSVGSFNMLSKAADGDFFDRQPTPVIFADGTEGIVEDYEHSASVTGSFTVSAPWTENREMQVAADLMLGGVFLTTNATPALQIPFETASGQLVWPSSDLSGLPSQWTSGSIDVVAADGSQLSLRPMTDDPTSALVEISGISEPQQVLWSDGFQVRCFGNPDEFVNCH